MNEIYGIELDLITSKFKEKIERVKSTFTGIKNQNINISTNTAQLEYLKKQIQELKADLQVNSKTPFWNTTETLKAEAQLEKLNEQYERLKNNQQEIRVQGVISSNSITKGIAKITSRIKKFALSLFSIRGIYSLISRASSAYISQDTALANKLQAVWAGLGAILEPVISRIVNIMLKAVKYINVFIKALTGVDLLAKATSKSLNGANKSAKALSKTLAGFDELTNLDTTSDASGIGLADTFNNIEIDDNVVSIIQKFAEKTRELKTAWDELDPTMQKVLGVLGIGGLLSIITGKPGLFLGIGAVILGIDGLCKIFDKDLTNSATGLIELLGVAGLVGILTGNWGVAGAIAGVSFALVGLNELINGDTTDAIEGIILLLGGAGLVGVLLGGIKGLSLAIAIASVIILLRGLSDLFSEDASDSVKGFIEIVAGATGLIVTLSLIKGGIEALLSPLNLVILGFVAFAAGVALVIKNWNNMSTLQKVVSVLGLIAIGAATAAAAVGALQSAWSLGIAAAAIVAGTVAIAAAVANANKKAKENIPQLAVGTNYVPEDQLAYIHKGEAVVPKKFNSQEYFGGSDDETKSLLQEIREAVDRIEINPYITIKDIGQASDSYYKSKERRTGKKVFA